MESDIKCLECDKITRKVELGETICNIDKPSETILVKEVIICPKCNKDISNGKCALKTNDTLMRLVAANISISIGSVPKHLMRAYSVDNNIYRNVKSAFKSKPKLISKF